MPLLTALCLIGALLVCPSINGQCRTDCTCVDGVGTERRCCLNISENLPPGSSVGNANDLAFIANNFSAAPYVFTPTNDEEGALFNFNEETGAIATAVSIDREAIISESNRGCLGLTVQGGNGEGTLSPITRFGIVIIDENDNRPQFDISTLNITVRENNAPSTLNCPDELRLARARDRDVGRNAEVTYKVAEGHGSNLFRVIDPQSPCVENLVPMDRENISIVYSFVLVAMDGGDPQLSSNITVTFTLEDVNDNAPVFLDPITNISVFENTPIGTVLHQFNATDVDVETQPLRYSLMSSNSIPFQINPESGELNLTGALNVEVLDDNLYRFSVLARDNNSVPHTSTLNITVNVIDVNEPAMVDPGTLPIEILEEEIPKNNLTLVIRVDDNDELPANQVNVIRIVSGGEYFQVQDPRFLFGLQIFDIRQSAVIDRENVINGIVQLSLIVEQMGNPPLQYQFQHNITILDINDNAPYLINTANFSYPEADGQNTSNQVREKIELMNYVRDDDAGENGTIDSVTLMSANGNINDNKLNIIEHFRRSNGLDENNRELHNGRLQLPSLDREQVGSPLSIVVKFTDAGTPPLSRVETFTIELTDVNDNSPKFSSHEYNFSVSEDDGVGFIIGSVSATDADDGNNGSVVYSLDKTRGDHNFFAIDLYNGSIRNKKVLNREEKPTFTFYVLANDLGSPPKTANPAAKVTVTVNDTNDEPPVFEMLHYTFEVNNGTNVGDFVGIVVATDPDPGSTENQIAYKFLVPGPYFSINNSSGLITIASVLSIQDAPYNLTVVAFNPGFEHLNSTATVSVAVVEPVPFIIIIGASAGGAALLIVAIILICCLILCVRHISKTGKLEVDRNGALNNQKPILKTLPATNGQQRSVKFSTTVEETHYDPSGTQVIRKESNIVSGDNLPQTSLRTTSGVPNGAMGANSPEEIVDYDMSPPNLGINGDIPSHHRSQYPRHGRMTSPIMLQEELNPSEFSQSTGSVVDDRNTYNSKGEEVESTYSDAPSNFNTSIPRFGRQTVPVENHHHPADLGRYGPPPSHPLLDIHPDPHFHLPPVHRPGPHSSPGHLPELRAHNLAVLNAQYASSSHPPPVVPPGVDDVIRDLSINSLPRNISHHHHHHGSIGHGSPHASTPPQTRHLQQRVAPPPSNIRQPPPVSIPHSSMITPAPSSNGHTNSRNYPHPLVMPEAFPSRPPSDVHRFDSFIPSFTDCGETSTYASTELYHYNISDDSIRSHYQPLQDLRHGEMPSPMLPLEDFNLLYGVDGLADDDNSAMVLEEAESTLSNLPSRSMPHFGRLMRQDSNPSKRAESTQTSSDASTVHSDPVFRNLPGNYSQISATTNSSGTGSSVDVAHILLQANITSRRNINT